jgi:hypothetical protein
VIIAKTESGTLIFGLSRRNIELLMEGRPIMKEAMGDIPRFAIVFGETEQEIFEQLVTEGFDMPSIINMPTVNKVPT